MYTGGRWRLPKPLAPAIGPAETGWQASLINSQRGVRLLGGLLALYSESKIMLNNENIRANIDVVKRLISMREKIYTIQRELNTVREFLDQTADDFMAYMIANGAVEEKNYTADKMEDLSG